VLYDSYVTDATWTKLLSNFFDKIDFMDLVRSFCASTKSY